MAPYTQSIPRARKTTQKTKRKIQVYSARGAAAGRGPAVGDGGRKVNNMSNAPRRDTVQKEVREEAIVINSDSDSDSDDGDDGDEEGPSSLGSTVKAASRVNHPSPAGPGTPRRRFSGWDDVDPKTLTKQTTTPSRFLVKQEDTASTVAKSRFLDGTYPEKKILGRAPASSENETHTLGRRLHSTPSALTISDSEGSGTMSKPIFSKQASGVENNKTRTSPRVSQLKSTKTDSGTAATTANRNSTLPENSSSILPAFPPAVKQRVYSTSQPGVQRSISNGSKKLESFGFTPASSLVAGTATATVTTPNATTSMPQPASTSHSIHRPTGHGLATRFKSVQVQGATPPTTQNTASAPRAPVPIVKTEPRSKRLDLGSIPTRTDTLPSLPLPRTPENPKAVKWGPPLTSSIGTAGDPYSISSDSDSDSDEYDGDNVINDRDGGDDESGDKTDKKPHSAPPLKLLKSFADLTDAQHETASDVEAVLKQFPVWLDSPSPTELKYSYEVSSGILRPVLPTRTRASEKTSADDHSKVDNEKDVKNSIEKREGQTRGKRHIRFSGEGDDAFGPYSSPTKRTALADSSWGALAARRIHIASSPIPVKPSGSTLSSSATSRRDSFSSCRGSASSSLRPDLKRQQIKPKLNLKSKLCENHDQEDARGSRSLTTKEGNRSTRAQEKEKEKTKTEEEAKSKKNEKDKTKRKQTRKRKEMEKKKQKGGKARARHRNMNRLQIQNLQREIERLAEGKPERLARVKSREKLRS